MHQRPLEREYIYIVISYTNGLKQGPVNRCLAFLNSYRRLVVKPPLPSHILTSLSSCQSLKLAYFTLATKFQLLSHSFFFYFGLARVRLLNFCFTVLNYRLCNSQYFIFYSMFTNARLIHGLGPKSNLKIRNIEGLNWSLLRDGMLLFICNLNIS